MEYQNSIASTTGPNELLNMTDEHDVWWKFVRKRERMVLRKVPLPPNYTPSSVKRLSLGSNTLRLYRAKHLVLMNWNYGDTGYYNG